MPLYVAFAFILHPVLGWVTVGGALFLIAVTLLTERLMRAPGEAAAAMSKQRWAIAEASDRNAEVLRAMGFCAPLHAPAGGGQRRAHRRQRAPLRRDGRLLGGVEGVPADAAVGAAGARRVPDHQGRDDGGRHHRLLDCGLARAGADRGGDRQLAGFDRSTQGARAAGRGAGLAARRERPAAAAGAGGLAQGGERSRWRCRARRR